MLSDDVEKSRNKAMRREAINQAKYGLPILDVIIIVVMGLVSLHLTAQGDTSATYGIAMVAGLFSLCLACGAWNPRLRYTDYEERLTNSLVGVRCVILSIFTALSVFVILTYFG